jgi:protease-4
MLRKANTDKRISSVILRPTSAAALWGKVQEVREAIVDFRHSGKPIVAYLEYGGEQEFYLATACDKVFLMPSATLDLTGMASYELFLRGTLDKIGAYPDALHIGEYKTASNMFTEHTYTPAHREMAESLNNDMFDQLVRGGAARRADRRSRLRGRARRQGETGAGQGVVRRDERLQTGERRQPGIEPRPAHRNHLRRRHHRVRQELVRLARRRRRRFRHDG